MIPLFLLVYLYCCFIYNNNVNKEENFMEYSYFELVTKSYPIIKNKGYIKGETTNYIKDNYDNLSEKTSFVEVSDFSNWIENKYKEKNSDYLRSLLELRKNKVVKDYQLNLLLSGLDLYFKDLKAQEERNNNPSTYVGNIGDKIEFIVKDFKLLTSRSYGYGWSSNYYGFYRIVGTDNNIYLWGTSLEGIKEGSIIRATVKDHKDYKGEKQTVITRGKIINNLEPEDDFIDSELLKGIY